MGEWSFNLRIASGTFSGRLYTPVLWCLDAETGLLETMIKYKNS
jgi:hypothetical protein